ncbi:MAG: hypothetical protein K2Q23_02250, partial [Bryobacteraceae bacterium]|nr:hypothetical protein [Bryobacteraceae bacterium]
MSHRLPRREMLEQCITRGLLVAGASLSQVQLLTAWQKAEEQAQKPTAAEVLGPFYRKGAPDTRVLKAPGDAGFPLHV